MHVILRVLYLSLRLSFEHFGTGARPVETKPDHAIPELAVGELYTVAATEAWIGSLVLTCSCAATGLGIGSGTVPGVETYLQYAGKLLVAFQIVQGNLMKLLA